MRSENTMKRLSALAFFAVLLGSVPAYTLGATSGSSSRVITANVGDIVRVAGAGDVGCRVIHRNGFETLDCRRAGPLAGTYGTLFNKREVLVVRFKDAKTAKVVVEPRHG